MENANGELLSRNFGWARLLFPVAALALIFAVLAAVSISPVRTELTEALRAPGQQKIGFFDCPPPGAMLSDRSLALPGQGCTYDGVYLQEFARRAGVSGVRRYVEKVLLGWDIMLLTALAVLFLSFNSGMVILWRTRPALRRLALGLAGIGLVYGIADVAENLTLVRSLLPLLENLAAPVDDAQARAANLFTHIKLISFAISAAGVMGLLLVSFFRHPGQIPPAKPTS
jgi:hypothetical protein